MAQNKLEEESYCSFQIPQQSISINMEHEDHLLLCIRVWLLLFLYSFIKREEQESEDQQLFHHFSHRHPLKLTEIKNHGDDEFRCIACQKPQSGQTYVCCGNKCMFSFHHSCFHLPQKIHHPFHSIQALTLTSDFPQTFCNGCMSVINYSFKYCSPNCDFNLHVECPETRSIIKYQGHHHNLVFAENILRRFGEPPMCQGCGSGCLSSSRLFRCPKCIYFLHFECDPLPCTIKHEDHIHPLTLTDSPVFNAIECEDKGDDFYCDGREKKRNPRLPMCYCSDGYT